MRKLGSVLAFVFLYSGALGAQDMATKVRITRNPADVEECSLRWSHDTKPDKVKAKKLEGMTEEEITLFLKQETFQDQCDTLLILKENPDPKVRYLVKGYQCFDVRMTTNPNAVDGCKFLGNVEYQQSVMGKALTGEGVDLSTIHEILRAKAWRLGGDTVYFVSNDRESGLGEAYDCGSGLGSRD